eukprot:793767-Pyramimonas_sp.AAC.1
MKTWDELAEADAQAIFAEIEEMNISEGEAEEVHLQMERQAMRTWNQNADLKRAARRPGPQ